MASDSWKIAPDPSAIKSSYTPLSKSRKFFAVDDSGSTTRVVLRNERAFVESLRTPRFSHQNDSISLWGTTCDQPTSKFGNVRWTSTHGATYPDEILKQPQVVSHIQKSDIWFLLTDGEIYERSVHELANLAYERDVLRVPIISVIVASRQRTPGLTNISVGVSFFAGAQDALILFKEVETGKIFVIAGKGSFSSLGGSTAAQNLSSWNGIASFSCEEEFFKHCADLNIKVMDSKSRNRMPKGISLGSEWEEANDGHALVDLDLLLQAGRLSNTNVFNLFAGEAFSNLAVACKTRRRTEELRTFIQTQRMEQITPRFEDVSGAAIIIAQMGDPAITEGTRTILQQQLREAHSKNREQYYKKVAAFADSQEEKDVKKRNQLVDAAMRTLATIETASFNAEILSRPSNRAKRAEMVSSDNSIAMANLDLEGPAYKGYCMICCGDDEVMSICLKEPETGGKHDNTTDFALNFPLAAGASTKNINTVSSQNTCFQCALLGPDGTSIYKEQLKAIIPAVKYDGPNKKYINDQLYLALMGGLATGAAGIAQLFMSILDEVLTQKAWAGAGLDDSDMSEGEQQEVIQRQHTLQWMLKQLAENTRTRETFTEVGDWVQFPQALNWVARDFEENKLTSFATTYPKAGFRKLLSLGKRTRAISDNTARRLKISKAVYEVTSNYLADLQNNLQHSARSEEWKQKYLETIYQDFNASLVPRNIELDSIITDTKTFRGRLAACLGQSASEDGEWTVDDEQIIMHKIQVVLFWLIYQQQSHCTARTFFDRMCHTEHLASAVFDASLSVPEFELRSTLLSIFTSEDSQPIDIDVANFHRDHNPPFKNPFGPSVLGCGIEACGTVFCEPDFVELTPRIVEQVRTARADHLTKVYGIQNRFKNIDTGLPEPCTTGGQPTSFHTNLHIGIARAWAQQTRDRRRAIINHEEERATFVLEARKNICKQGRGDVFKNELDQDIAAILPSFFNVLAQALRMNGERDDDVSAYEHDFENNKMEHKIRWEMRARGLDLHQS